MSLTETKRAPAMGGNFLAERLVTTVLLACSTAIDYSIGSKKV